MSISTSVKHRPRGLPSFDAISIGWFYGFKLHLVINDQGKLLAFLVTPTHVDDRKPVPKLARHVFGKLIGDKGYLSKALFEALPEQGDNQLILVNNLG